ncbi:myoD family inhibitor-like isoform X2 [Xenopus tropicalis]|uniref:MyoD family inhibitor-like isoform X2 n=1 Tax=Xenopus tropicalis TaxID=8364 RepID=A0A8J1IQZ2_XENTR|nr:myoD family inhibitor-like isoform X2 [Xenopus tropicalis]
MSEGHPGTPGNLPAISGGARISAEPPETPGDTEENDPRGARLSPEPTCPKHQNRGSSRRKKTQGPKLSARHIEQAAGDDSCALCLLAGLFCEASMLCSALLACVSCGPCADGAPCCSPCSSGCASVGGSLCDCLTASEGCRSSDCLDLCLECCALCFPS